ncbi:hypothetical protein MLD52_03980 [Puniceicoccaceae bacterium K14]|nr:hypothetical protein [Puniceicoccaceae bacterium K14]
MIPFAIALILFPSSIIVWFFGIRPYVKKHTNNEYTGANIAISAWNEFSVAIEVRRETQKSCPYIEIFAVMEITAMILFIIGIVQLS